VQTGDTAIYNPPAGGIFVLRRSKMDKIQIMTTCQACRGVTYFASTVTTEEGNLHTTYQPCYASCYACRGSGIQLEWIDLREFVGMLDAIRAENRSPKSQK
jgi:hypothetical protein